MLIARVGSWLPLAGLAAATGVSALMVGAIAVRTRAGQRSAAPYVPTLSRS